MHDRLWLLAAPADLGACAGREREKEEEREEAHGCNHKVGRCKVLRAERLAAQLKALGVEPESPDESA